MSRTTLLIFIALALSGCVAVWGHAYNIESQDADSIIIKYDRHFASSGDVQNVAQASCARYGKDAASQGESTSIWGLTTVPFACVKP